MALAMALSACSGGKAPAETAKPETVFTPRTSFSADSAYSYVARQVSFGPRVPGTAPHRACADWLVETLRGFGADTVMVVGEEALMWNGDRVPVRNVFARFRGTGDGRPVLLAAHYDTRPWADEDPDPARRGEPFDGANDGASGVGVILEIARNIGAEPASAPVDILFTDVEDYGSSGIDGSWCVGAQQFAASHYPIPGGQPRWGILLDMVGGTDARFPYEMASLQIAPAPTAKVWDMARRLGLERRFPARNGGSIVDDHIYLYYGGIPTTDIIDSQNPATGSFPPTWHTHSDNLSNIDARVLSDVGAVVLNVVYDER